MSELNLMFLHQQNKWAIGICS